MAFMTTNVLKNLVGRYSTRLYPITTRAAFDAYRGELYNEIEKCIFCQNCARKCPSQCISVDKEIGTWVCDPFACVYCGLCVEACPVNCLHMKSAWRHVATGREMIEMQGTPPKPKKKKTEDAAAPAEDAEAKAKKPAKK
ncbi:4Fe-4S ferredoxin iron-sulfur binding domain-containing protein [Alkalidesulfovibrio alkalitolerans DSM 16529]|jgi:ech hydrogenase subunit F|uniref:4Fe-4S ferredoxin iron-sulfur binding domain-containing protein n=1 Tax=Alkalidesulfovibrio alkalitolerans DSM 16529 TaxID=1121439 RepID=S7T4P1_9BACT|nr:4Fe-4S binding protein [Alkalidesulfovibrio alkalitolerans]EPR31591.1 4Fe-4S ferredoxin iron-sulfur binding domain-containing protein [Alkalidesulfovibrio alkalitolerans DSM 16529]